MRVRVAGIEQEFNSNAKARSSFNYQCEITMEKGIKAKGNREKAAFRFLGLGFHKRSVLFHSFGEGLEIRVEDFIFLKILDFKRM